VKLLSNLGGTCGPSRRPTGLSEDIPPPPPPPPPHLASFL